MRILGGSYAAVVIRGHRARDAGRRGLVDRARAGDPNAHGPHMQARYDELVLRAGHEGPAQHGIIDTIAATLRTHSGYFEPCTQSTGNDGRIAWSKLEPSPDSNTPDQGMSGMCRGSTRERLRRATSGSALPSSGGSVTHAPDMGVSE